LNRAKQVLKKSPQGVVDFVFFTEEKVFFIAPPVSLQCVPCRVRKCKIAVQQLLRTWRMFSKLAMFSVVVPTFGSTEQKFVESGMKVDGTYHRDVLLTERMLPAIHRLEGDV